MRHSDKNHADFFLSSVLQFIFNFSLFFSFYHFNFFLFVSNPFIMFYLGFLFSKLFPFFKIQFVILPIFFFSLCFFIFYFSIRFILYLLVVVLFQHMLFFTSFSNSNELCFCIDRIGLFNKKYFTSNPHTYARVSSIRVSFFVERESEREANKENVGRRFDDDFYAQDIDVLSLSSFLCTPCARNHLL